MPKRSITEADIKKEINKLTQLTTKNLSEAQTLKQQAEAILSKSLTQSDKTNKLNEIVGDIEELSEELNDSILHLSELCLNSTIKPTQKTKLAYNQANTDAKTAKDKIDRIHEEISIKVPTAIKQK